MRTSTVSFRMDSQEKGALEELARDMGMDRSACLKHLVRRAFAAAQFERACQAYRAGAISLSRAAEMAGLSLRDMILRLPGSGLEMNYDLASLRDDLKP